jgi:predicted Zn-dependent protease
LLSLAQAHEMVGARDAAEALYREILERRPGHCWAELGRAELALRGCDARGARTHLRRVLASIPNWTYPRELLARTTSP